jgi:hypothetical protein
VQTELVLLIITVLVVLVGQVALMVAVMAHQLVACMVAGVVVVQTTVVDRALILDQEQMVQ